MRHSEARNLRSRLELINGYYADGLCNSAPSNRRVPRAVHMKEDQDIKQVDHKTELHDPDRTESLTTAHTCLSNMERWKSSLAGYPSCYRSSALSSAEAVPSSQASRRQLLWGFNNVWSTASFGSRRDKEEEPLSSKVDLAEA